MNRRLNGSAARAIDRIDRRILKALQADGRKSISELAREVYLTTSPCLDRVHRLEQEGYIQGYTALLDPNHLGARLLAFAEVRVDRTAPEAFQKFRALVESLDEVVECHMVAGGFDYLIKIRVADMDAYRRFFGEHLSTLPGIVQITTTWPWRRSSRQRPSSFRSSPGDTKRLRGPRIFHCWRPKGMPARQNIEFGSNADQRPMKW